MAYIVGVKNREIREICKNRGNWTERADHKSILEGFGHMEWMEE